MSEPSGHAGADLRARRTSLRCDDLDPFFDGELPEEGAELFRGHLGDCERCQEVLRGRMLESLAVSTPAPPRTAIRRRPLARWMWAPALAAATVTGVLLVKRDHTSGGSAGLVAPGAVALALKQERGVDVRFSASALDEHRRLGVVRSANSTATGAAREAIDLEQLAALKKRNDLHALVGAQALNGDVAGALDQARALPDTAEALSDLAALSLLDPDPSKVQANAERALVLAVRARRLQPGLEQARWNEAVALERLRLSLSAAEAFEAISRRGGGGWPAEAAARGARLRQGYEADLARWKQLQEAALRMERGGAPLTAAEIQISPSLARKALHVAAAAAAEPARLDALAPVAEALGLAPELAPLRAKLGSRAPVARRFAAALAKPEAGELRAIRALARRAGAEDIARASLLAMGEFLVEAEDVAELEAMAAAGGWWRLAAAQRLAFYRTYNQRAYVEADFGARDAVEACRAGARERDPYWCPRILRTIAATNSAIGRVDRAYELGAEAQRLADAAGDRREEGGVFNAIGQIAATRFLDAIDPSAVSDAYMREAAHRLGNCRAQLYRLDFASRAALDHHRYADAAGYLAEAEQLGRQGGEGCEQRLNAEEIRLGLILRQPTQERVDALAANLRRYEDLDPGQRLFGEFLLARARFALSPDATHAAALRAVIAKAPSPGDVYARQVRAQAHSALAEDAARRGAGGEALAEVAARTGVALEPGCAVGINHDDRVTVVVRGADGSAAAAVHDVPEGRRVLATDALLSPPLRERLRGCPRIEVLATGPYFGVPGLLGPELRWAYRSSPRPVTAAPHLDAQVVVTDVDSPPELGLAPLRRMDLGPKARIVQRAAATPEGVLAAIADAGLVVINAHGVTDANEPAAASLVLSPDPRTKGSYWLTAERVRQARLSAAPVVILAACHAGRVQVSSQPWSLASSFLAAGARAVIAPTTEISDDMANEVFASIVGRMQQGKSPEQAVAEEREARGKSVPWLAGVVVFQ